MQLKISEATDDQIRDFATTFLQIDVSACGTRSQLMAAIGPAWPQEFIHVMDTEPTGQVERVYPKPEAIFETGRDDGPITVFKVLQTDMPGGKHPAAPDVNGKKIVIQRGLLVGVPYAFYLALMNAKVAIPSQAEGLPGAPQPDVIFTEVTNYPISEVQLPPQSEIDAWHKRNGDRLLGGEAPVRLAA